MNRLEIIDTLKNLGLSEYESKAYSTLLIFNHLKASEISKESGIPQSKIYEVLERLVEKKLIEVYTIRPKEFKVIAPQSILESLIREKEKEILNVKKRIKDLIKIVNSNNDGTEVMDGFWASKEKGYVNFFKRVCEMYERSREYIYIISRNFSWAYDLGRAFRAATKRGVEVHAIGVGEMNKLKRNRAKWFYDHGAKIRIIKNEIHPSLVDVDGKEALLRLDVNPTKKKKFVFTSIYSRDVSLVKVLDTYVKNLWKRARPLSF